MEVQHAGHVQPRGVRRVTPRREHRQPFLGAEYTEGRGSLTRPNVWGRVALKSSLSSTRGALEGGVR